MSLPQWLLPDLDRSCNRCNDSSNYVCRTEVTRKNNCMSHRASGVVSRFLKAAVLSAVLLPALVCGQPEETVVPQALQITKKVDPTSLHPGETGKYTIVVTYNGAGSANNVL